ncbi:MAG: hypothetical protein GWN18_01375, partial [Thermoplasmata archaeon]|nr:hypothetical protein [Thermoplasmata archaeon]NIS18607.1 hypothetical protein [Thermoplasmata archaeon]NIT75598.1 hypothetical protein [Thermoplasmata archaeon]NIV77409.1 hypothetical protein [Thermoplasmata archaeon]NIW81239.1 hypothetical protein [Thermoplasmata archaeon]
TLVTMDAYASTDNVAITRYEWKFFYEGDHQFLYGRVVTWRFDLPGEYQVILVVYDGASNHDTDSLV